MSLHLSRAARTPIVLLVAFALALPGLATAQTQAMSRKDLIGTWALQGSKEFGFIFKDTTVVFRGQNPNGKISIAGNWQLHGDTLIVGHTIGWLNGKRPVPGRMAPRSVAITGNQLTVTRLDNKQAQVYERVDSLQSAGGGAAAPKP